jgi:hypothetical protein
LRLCAFAGKYLAQRRKGAKLLSCVLSILFLISACGFSARAQSENARRARTVSAQPAAEATITLNEQFLNSLLDAMFTRLREPEFPLSIAQDAAEDNRETVLAAHAPLKSADGCASVIVLERERDGVKTAIHFEDGRIIAPLAFSGTYDAGLGCLSFSGWARALVTLEFDRERQALVARVRVEQVQLTGIPSLANGVVVSLVQGSIDKRFNPYELLKAEQLSPTVPIKAAGGALRLRAREMRPELISGALRIHIIYDFERAP